VSPIGWLHVHYVEVITLLLSSKNVHNEGNLNHIGSLRRKMTIIVNGNVGIWARHARFRACRYVTWRDGLSGILAIPWNFEFATAGRTEMLAAGNFVYWYATVVEVLWGSVPKTLMNSHGKLVLLPLWISQPVQIITQQPWKTTLVFLGSWDQAHCSVQNSLQLLSINFLTAGQSIDFENCYSRRWHASPKIMDNSRRINLDNEGAG